MGYPSMDFTRIRKSANSGTILAVLSVLALTLGMFSSGCGGRDPIEQEFRELMRIPGGPARYRVFRQKPYCRQIDIYLYGMSKRPPLILAHYVAGNGKDILPVLLDRLEKEPVERNQEALILVLSNMATLDPTLKENKEVVELVQRKVKGMSGGYRSEAEKSLHNILHPKQPSPN